MSDAPDLDEVDLEFPAGAPTDWRERLVAACRAAGVSPLLAAVVAASLVVAIVGAGAVFALRGGARPPVENTLPFSRPPEVTTTTSEPPPGDIVVHVAGAVAAPGVYRLPVDARVVDAVDAAGGPAVAADMARVNLAAPLADGQQVYVVAVGEPPPAPVTGASAGDSGAEAETSPLVDINQASAGDLEALPGIGPALAAAIVGHREEHGPFVAVESLLDVSGIGEAKLAGLRDFATI